MGTSVVDNLPSADYSVLERLPVAVLVADDDGRYTFANKTACALLSCSPEDILGLTPKELAGDGIDADAAWKDFLQSGHQSGEFVLRRPSGDLVTVQFNATTHFAPGLHISVLADITDRKRVDSVLRRNEELYIRLFNGSPAPTNLRDLTTGRFIEVNAAFNQATGYARADIIGRTARSVGLWNDRGQLDHVLDELRGGAQAARLRTELMMRDRSVREFSVAFQRVDFEGRPHAIATYTDIASL